MELAYSMVLNINSYVKCFLIAETSATTGFCDLDNGKKNLIINTSCRKQIDPPNMPTNLRPTCRVQLEAMGNMVMLPFFKSATTKMAIRAVISGLNSI
jgi:hypothetical protein